MRSSEFKWKEMSRRISEIHRNSTVASERSCAVSNSTKVMAQGLSGVLKAATSTRHSTKALWLTGIWAPAAILETVPWLLRRRNVPATISARAIPRCGFSSLRSQWEVLPGWLGQSLAPPHGSLMQENEEMSVWPLFWDFTKKEQFSQIHEKWQRC